MSFGYSVGDFVLLVQLAHKTFRNCQKAGEEYIEVACEVRCLHSVLRVLRSESKRPESKIFSQGKAATTQLIETADGCKNVLENLDYILTKYQGLNIDGRKSTSKKIWQRFRFGSKSEELGAIRGKLATYTSTISIMIDTMHIKATDRAEKKLDRGFADMSNQMSGQFERIRKEIYTIASGKRAEERRGATISTLSLSTYAGDEKSVWQDFRKELIGKGFQSSSLERHKHLLQAYMLKLDQSGLLDKDDVSASGALNRSSWWMKKTYMETVNSIAEKSLSSRIIADHDMPSIAEEDGSKKQEQHEGVHESSSGTRSPEKLPSAPDSAVQKPSILPWVQESAPKSLDSVPDEHEPPTLSASASSSDTETNDDALDKTMPTIANQDLSVSMVQSKSEGAKFDASDSDTQNVISKDATALEPLQKEENLIKKRPKPFVRDEAEEKGLEIGTEPNASPNPFAASSSTADNDFFMQSSTISSLLASSHPIPEQSKETVRIARRPKALHIETADEILHEPNSPITPNHWSHSDGEKISIDQAISIDGTSRRHRHREGERRQISSRTRNVIESWEAMRNSSGDRGNRDSEHLSPIRPRSLPLSPMRPSAPKIHQKSNGTIKSRHSRSRSTPISPLRPLPPEIHQSATKVHYRSSTIEIVNFPSRDSISTTNRISLPRKSILKAPTKQFPEDPNPVREGVAPLKDAKKGGIPVDARWTKVSRTLVNPEALKAAKERFEATDDFVIVLRVLDREEIDEYAKVTQKIRAIREIKEENDRKIEMNKKRKQASEVIQHGREYLQQEKDK